MPSPFEVATLVHPLGDGRFRVVVPDGWQQGRGAFGGLVLASLLRAAEATEADRTRTTRTIMGELIGPVLPGEHEIVTRVLRRGAHQSNVRAELVSAGEVVAEASVVLSHARANVAVTAARPERPRLEDVAVMPILGPGPVFAQWYEYRPAFGIPFIGASEPATGGYVREREVPSAIDAPALVALLDAWYPAAFPTLTEPRAMATVSFAAEILCDPSTIDPRAHLFATCRAIAAHEGFVVELRELHDGERVLAMNQQTFVALR
jgi:hypothetical protein